MDSWNLSREKETDEKLCEIIELSKQKSIYAVLKDNAASGTNMLKMGRLTCILYLTCTLVHRAAFGKGYVTNNNTARKSCISNESI